MLIWKKASIYFAIKLSLSEISDVVCAGVHVRMLMSWKSCTVGMRSAILSNHLNLFRTSIIKKGEKQGVRH